MHTVIVRRNVGKYLSRPTQPPILSETGDDYRPKWLGVDRTAHSIMWINGWVASKTV